MELPLDAYLIGYADDITALIVTGDGVETQISHEGDLYKHTSSKEGKSLQK